MSQMVDETWPLGDNVEMLCAEMLRSTPSTLAYGGQLSADHPGFTDLAYRRRRQVIADIAADYRPGQCVPDVPYSDEEHAVWSQCARALARRHLDTACSEFLEGADQLGLPQDHVPQLREVTDLLRPLSGFRYEPVPGLVSPSEFYAALSDRRFMSTQYIRHHSVPSYTPEPDIIHEVIGHANQLASRPLASLYLGFGQAVQKLRSESAIAFLSRLFWFTVEFGVVYERGALKAYGAGILSSVGELDAFSEAEIRAFDPIEMGITPYDITQFQPILFAADSMRTLIEELLPFLANFNDDAFARIADAQQVGRP